jgi:hypothetical protein
MTPSESRVQCNDVPAHARRSPASRSLRKLFIAATATGFLTFFAVHRAVANQAIIDGLPAWTVIAMKVMSAVVLVIGVMIWVLYMPTTRRLDSNYRRSLLVTGRELGR